MGEPPSHPSMEPTHMESTLMSLASLLPVSMLLTSPSPVLARRRGRPRLTLPSSMVLPMAMLDTPMLPLAMLDSHLLSASLLPVLMLPTSLSLALKKGNRQSCFALKQLRTIIDKFSHHFYKNK